MTKKTLGVFIDESGNFDFISSKSKYYVFTLVFHDQSVNLQEHFKESEIYLVSLGYDKHNIHTNQLVRGKDEYENVQRQTRLKLFNHLFRLQRNIGVKFMSFVYDKTTFETKEKMLYRMTRDLSILILENQDYFSKFAQTIVYYDNGQNEIQTLIDVVMEAHFNNMYRRNVIPAQKKLFQVADMICTLELLNIKYLTKNLNKSDLTFFGSYSDLYRNYLRKIEKYRF